MPNPYEDDHSTGMMWTAAGELRCYINSIEVTQGEYLADLTDRINLLEAQKVELRTRPQRKHVPPMASGTLPA